ncbi:MAG: oxidoreductase [Gammaproteobacteria bacterium]|nr:oxidoreductase [Gammaproteobacteria bacterium]
MEDNAFYDELFSGLRALAESAFPKKCANCGRTFETAEQFLLETQNINETRTGLKASSDDDGSTIVEVFRNCPCGSTLMDFFSDRRDLSPAGLERRKKFGQLVDFLVNNGVEPATARNELLKVVHGEQSELLAKYKPPKL